MSRIQAAVVLIAVLSALAMWTDLSIFVKFRAEALLGKRVVVCGASTGIGEQIAYQYASFNASVRPFGRLFTDD